MRIAKVHIQNYKSFFDSEEISFTPGFNVIVGQNNVGKTALVEALSLIFKNYPHRSLKSLPKTSTRLEMNSQVGIKFEFNEREIFDLIIDARQDFAVPVTSDLGGISLLQQAHEIIRKLPSIHEIYYHYNDGKLSYARLLEHINFKHFEARKIDFPANQNPSATDKVTQLEQSFIYTYGDHFRQRIYIFTAERLRISEHPIGNRKILESDASNLPEVLHKLQTEDPATWEIYVHLVQEIFPDIKYITVPSKPDNAGVAHIRVWTLDYNTRRTDLTMSLSDCGTGIGQVLAMLYVVITSDYPRSIIIDEPQSFLHLGAVRKLFEILKTNYSQHQYIITTHSPTAVTAANPQTILLVRKEESESKVTSIDVNESRQMQIFLSEVGARLSDVFGSDNILWVEGQTEEQCFPLILSELRKKPLLGTTILSVKQTGDLEGKHAKTVYEIYDRLSKGRGLLPPAIGFVFDREGRTELQMRDLERSSHNVVVFLPRKLYENYLLNPDALAAIMTSLEGFRDTPMSPVEVTNWINNHLWSAKYFTRLENRDEYEEMSKANSDKSSKWWLENVHGAELLEDIFEELSQNKVPYEKIEYGVALTHWLIENEPDDLKEIADLLETVLNREIA